MLSRLLVPDTFDYMIAGYVILSVVITLYITSIALRWKKTNQQYKDLKSSG
jgi:hypothetical protein